MARKDDWKRGIQDTNWYVALDLAFDPPEEDLEVIKQRIMKKRSEWNLRSADPTYGALYSMYIQKADQMERDLSDPQKRRNMYEEAREAKFGPLDKVLKQVCTRAEDHSIKIERQKIQRIVELPKIEALGFSQEDVENRAADLHIDIIEDEGGTSSERYQSVYDNGYNKVPAQHEKYFKKFNAAQAHLSSVGKSDFYSFLFPDVDDPHSLTREELYQAAEDKRKECSKGKISQEKTNLRNAAADARQAFKDDEARKAYDEFLAFNRRKDVIDEIEEEIKTINGGKYSRSESEAYVKRLMPYFPRADGAAEFFVAMCEVKGFLYDVGKEASPSLENVQACRCGCLNDTSDGRTKCVRCGRELWQTCPKCGKSCPNTYNYCGCGFKFADIYQAERVIQSARKALDACDPEKARDLLAQANKLCPGHEEIASIEDDLKRMEGKIGSRTAKIKRRVEGGYYCQAKDLIEALRRSYPQYGNPPLESRIASQIEAAQQKYRQAQAATSKGDVLELCGQAFEECRDLPGLQELASRYSDLPLEALSVGSMTPKNPRLSVANGRVILRLDLPDEGETDVAVAWRHDKEPTGIDDPRAQVKEVPVTHYERYGYIDIENAHKRRYFVAVCLKTNVSERSYCSALVRCQLNLQDKVVLTYSFKRRGLFSKEVRFSLTSDRPVDKIPQIEIVYQQGYAPVDPESSKHLQFIAPRPLSDKFECDLKLPSSLPRNMYVKPFLQDGGTRFQLKLATGSTNQIS